MKTYNGGITLTCGAVSVDTVSEYSIAWTNEFDTDISGNMTYLSRTAELSVTTGILTESETAALLAVFKASGTVTITTPQLSGSVSITSFSAPLESASLYGKFYRLSFTAVKNETAGAAVSVGGISPIASYSGSWNYETESFEAWNFETVEIGKGWRFSCDFTTGKVSKADINAFKAILSPRVLTNFSTPDGVFTLVVTSVSTAMTEGGKYTLSASLTSLSLSQAIPGGGA